MTLVKFCGISREEDVGTINRLHPDMMGFVFWEKSKRYVTKEKAVSLSKMLDPSICPVGVFLDMSFEYIADIAKTGCIKAVQLHGSEDERFVRDVQKETGLQVIRAFKISDRKDLEKAVSTDADMLMLDGGIGEGRTFDWSLLQDVERPYILAGGLNPENVGQAISKLHPYGVDVSSGIETDGVKDPVKMKLFMDAVKSAR